MDSFAAYGRTGTRGVLGRRARGKRARAAHGRRHAAARALLGLLLLVGVGLLAWPLAGNAYSRWQAEGVISEAASRYEAMDDPARIEVRRQAQLYNRVLAGEAADEQPLPYEEQLVYRSDPMISYLEVGKLGVRLPIYHGTDENALMAGVGHLETSSLPVGGEGTHCVLAGHSGMRGARMFDDLGRMAAGDGFTIWTLGEPYAYEVYGVETVLPDEVSSLAAVPGEDRCTLVTCTPYGVNSHRLLVHGRRCPYRDPAAEAGPPGQEAPGGPHPATAVALGACLLGAFAAAVGAVLRRRAPKRGRGGSLPGRAGG